MGAEDDNVVMATSDDINKETVTAALPTYVIQLCRKFKIFPSERTTVLTQNEEMQILQLQYCSALRKKKASSAFDANPKLCEKIHSEMICRRVNKLIADVHTKFFSNGDVKTNSNGRDELSDKDDPDNEDRKNDVLPYKNDNEKGDIIDAKIEKAKETEMLDADGADASVMSLFLESLRASNHFTLLDVFEKFLDEVIATESKLHAFIKSNMKEHVNICEKTPLLKVQILTMRVMRTIAGIDYLKEDELRNENAFQDADIVPDVNLQNDHSLSVMSSPLTMRIKDTPQKLKSAKTPVQALKSKHQLSSPLPTTPFTPRTDVERQQLLKKFIDNIFRCYLHLLVNTRCELALALVFNIPERELNHEAFTHLKHASAVSGLSMYQTMSSVLMRVRLGGHGYAPPSDSPLLPFIKGLGCLFDFVDKLQTVIEEAASPRSGCKRVVNILNRNISTCKSRRFSSSIVDSVASGLWEDLDDILSAMEKRPKDVSGDSDSQEDIVIGQESIDALRSYLDQSSTTVSDVDHYFLGDVRFSQDTPTRFPCLMSRYRSPLSYVEEECDHMDKGSTAKIDETLKQPKICKVSEALYLDDDDDDKVVCTPLDMDNVYIIPSKTIVHPKCGADYGESSEGLFSPATKLTNQKKCVPGIRKRKTDAVICDKGKRNGRNVDENSPMPKSRKHLEGGQPKSACDSALSGVNVKDKTGDGNKKQSKSCRRKLLPQIKGQSKITGFFKV